MASFHGARIHTSRSSSVVRITGIVFGWMGSTIAFGDVVRKPYTRCGPGIALDFVPLRGRIPHPMSNKERKQTINEARPQARYLVAVQFCNSTYLKLC